MDHIRCAHRLDCQPYRQSSGRGWLFRQLAGFHYQQHGFFTSIVVAIIGAIIVLLLYRAVGRARGPR
ncbi:MAG: GlsB/YeaQ/YmgE family stress response membrane protein [Rhizomicrobium sp.]